MTASANIKNPQTFNRYTYGLNSPYKFVDPTGLEVCTPGNYCTQGQETVEGSAADDDDCGERPFPGCRNHKNDDRPYIGDLVGEREDEGLDDSPFETFKPNGHDGNHWLTYTSEAIVSATQSLRGTVLTYYNQGDGGWTVLILLEDRKTVLILKDLRNLSKKVKKAPETGSGKGTIFTDRKGNPTSNIKLNAGDDIGTVAESRSLESGAAVIGGFFHFAFMEYNRIQQFRNLKAQGGDISEDSEVFYVKGIPKIRSYGTVSTAIPRSWFIDPCGASSPVRCK